MTLNGFTFKKIINKIKKLKRKKSWEPFKICLLNSAANPAQFCWKWHTAPEMSVSDPEPAMSLEPTPIFVPSIE